MEIKICSKCKETKLVIDFVKCKSRNGESGRKNLCKSCANTYKRTGISFTVSIDTAKKENERLQTERKENSEIKNIEMVCSRCKETKPVSDFHRSSREKNGRAQPCITCALVKAKIYKSTPTAREKRNDYQKKRSRKIRLEILQAYGSICACCGESELGFLAVDHINNDGAEHRKTVSSGSSFYGWLRRNNFPKDNFQLLCYNCNISKSLYGQCPHKTKEVQT